MVCFNICCLPYERLLVLTSCAGSEAMFADLGHFSYIAIQVGSSDFHIFPFPFIFSGILTCSYRPGKGHLNRKDLLTICHDCRLHSPFWYILHLYWHIWDKLPICRTIMIPHSKSVSMSQFQVFIVPAHLTITSLQALTLEGSHMNN